MSSSSAVPLTTAQSLSAKLRRIRNMTRYLENTIPDVPEPPRPNASSSFEPGVGTFLNRSV